MFQWITILQEGGDAANHGSFPAKGSIHVQRVDGREAANFIGG